MSPRKANTNSALTLAVVSPAESTVVESIESIEIPEPETVVESHGLTDLELIMRGADQNELTLPLYLQNWSKTVELLKAPFDPADLYFVAQGKDYDNKNNQWAAVYANSRVYTSRLNEVIGMGFWQSEVTKVTIAPFTKIQKAQLDWNNKNPDGSAKILSPQQEISAHKITMVVRVGIWMGPVLGWVWQDSTGGKDTSDGNWDTSAEAQGFKRAASKWGPGFYFYSFPKQSCAYDSKAGKWKQQPQIPDWAYPTNYCNDCGEQIVTVQYTDKDNITRSMHAWDIYLRGLTQYGVGVCPRCSKARRDAATSPEANSRLQEQQAA